MIKGKNGGLICSSPKGSHDAYFQSKRELTYPKKSGE